MHKLKRVLLVFTLIWTRGYATVRTGALWVTIDSGSGNTLHAELYLTAFAGMRGRRTLARRAWAARGLWACAARTLRISTSVTPAPSSTALLHLAASPPLASLALSIPSSPHMQAPPYAVFLECSCLSFLPACFCGRFSAFDPTLHHNPCTPPYVLRRALSVISLTKLRV